MIDLILFISLKTCCAIISYFEGRVYLVSLLFTTPLFGLSVYTYCRAQSSIVVNALISLVFRDITSDGSYLEISSSCWKLDNFTKIRWPPGTILEWMFLAIFHSHGTDIDCIFGQVLHSPVSCDLLREKNHGCRLAYLGSGYLQHHWACCSISWNHWAISRGGLPAISCCCTPPVHFDHNKLLLKGQIDYYL